MAQLPDKDALLFSQRNLVCPACGKAKKMWEPMCRKDLSRLPLTLRQPLWHTLIGKGYEAAMSAAIEQGIPYDGWTFKWIPTPGTVAAGIMAKTSAPKTTRRPYTRRQSKVAPTPSSAIVTAAPFVGPAPGLSIASPLSSLFAAIAASGATGKGIRMIKPEIVIEDGKLTIRAESLEAVAQS